MSELPIFESGFTKYPTLFVDELMPFAAGIPASFWKYMTVLWRDLFGVGCEKRGYRASKTMTQFHMTKETAMQWTAALGMSGLFKVTYGFRWEKNTPGVPTVFQYIPGSTTKAWQCFITALREQILSDKHDHFKAKANGVEGFRISLSFTVDDERERNGLPRLWDKWREELKKAGTLYPDPKDPSNLQIRRFKTDRSRLDDGDAIRLFGD